MIETKPTFCRLCEPLCGVIATVEDGRLASLAPDPDNPLSKGFVCPKGIAFTEIQNDPDRVLHPLRRTPSGEFERVSWDDALDDIARRLRALWERDGGSAISFYLGNPTGFSYSASMFTGGLANALGSTNMYSAGSQDTNSRLLASKLLYGVITQLPFPDLPRTDFLLMVGANPLVSHGGLVRAPRIREDLANITRRGGRVVVVDPRRTETARSYEHVAVRPDSDAWLLLSLLHVVFAEGLADKAVLDSETTGWHWLRNVAHGFAPEDTAVRTGVDAETVRQLARDFAAAPSATAYGRTGTCLGRHATLVCFLLDALSVVTGNLDRPGGTLFSQAVIPLEQVGERSGQISYDTARSRVGDMPDVIGTFPASLLAHEITTPGPGRVRALFCTAGNPVVSTPDARGLAEALQQLELFVSLDFYVNETNKYADYVLPAVTYLEREDHQFLFAAASPVPFAQYTEAVLEPYGEARHEWQVYQDIADRAGFALFVPGEKKRATSVMHAMARRGKALKPPQLMDFLLRIGPYGDRFGLRPSGLNTAKLKSAPHGIRLAEHAETGRRRRVVQHPGGKVRLDPPEIVAAVERLLAEPGPDRDFPLLMIGLREMRSLNSWLQHSPTLMKGDRRHRAHVNPDDASVLGLSDGDQVRITSRTGSLVTECHVSPDLAPGAVAVPHGWGVANSNVLTSAALDDIEPWSGMSHLNGVPVRLEPVTQT